MLIKESQKIRLTPIFNIALTLPKNVCPTSPFIGVCQKNLTGLEDESTGSPLDL